MTFDEWKAKIQGRDLGKEEEIKKNAEVATKATEARYGPQKEEAGVEEELDPVDTAMTIQSLGAAPAIRTAGNLAMNAAKKKVFNELKDKMPTKRAEVIAYKDALRGPGEQLESFSKNPAAAAIARQEQEKGLRFESQKLKDIVAGTRKVGGEIAPAQAPIDYGAIESSRIAEIRSKQSPTQNYSPEREPVIPREETLMLGNAGSTKQQRNALRDERMSLDLRTPEGRSRLQEIDKQLANMQSTGIRQ